jgi:hypothetical protein
MPDTQDRDKPGPSDEPAGARSVLLEHTTADGSVHLDWLIEQPGLPVEHRLIAFRCSTDPAGGPPWTGERLPDHRAFYLEYEGPISGGRGVVRRRWSRVCRGFEVAPARIALRFGDADPRIELIPAPREGPAAWIMRSIPGKRPV